MLYMLQKSTTLFLWIAWELLTNMCLQHLMKESLEMIKHTGKPKTLKWMHSKKALHFNLDIFIIVKKKKNFPGQEHNWNNAVVKHNQNT